MTEIEMPPCCYREYPSPNVRVAETMVDAHGRHYRVSTINRDSSAVLCPGRYAETIVFCEGKIVDQGEAAEFSRRTHDRMVLKWSSEDPEKWEEDHA